MGFLKKLFGATEDSVPTDDSVLSESKMAYAGISGDLPNDEQLKNMIDETDVDNLGFSGVEGVDENGNS